MLIRNFVFVVLVGMGAPSIAFADKHNDVNCSQIKDDDLRDECRDRKKDAQEKISDVDCSELDNNDARRECRERKYGANSKVQCRKLNSEALRAACLAEKWD